MSYMTKPWLCGGEEDTEDEEDDADGEEQSSEEDRLRLRTIVGDINW